MSHGRQSNLVNRDYLSIANVYNVAPVNKFYQVDHLTVCRFANYCAGTVKMKGYCFILFALTKEDEPHESKSSEALKSN